MMIAAAATTELLTEKSLTAITQVYNKQKNRKYFIQTNTTCKSTRNNRIRLKSLRLK